MKVHTIDLSFQGADGVIAAYLLESGGEAALIETGPGSTLENLLAGIARCGVRLEQITRVFVTHVHLDHAGAAGWWAQRGARVYCHPRARRHLIEPDRLIASARQVYGGEFDRLWGEMLPAPAAQVIALEDGETVRAGGVEVKAIDTPGHARHHHAFAAGGLCFTGDVAGVRLDGQDYLSVASAPPQFELEPYLESVAKLRALNFERLFLPHFGEVRDPAGHLLAYQQRLREVAERATASAAASDSEEEWRQKHEAAERTRARESGCDGGMWRRYQLANHTGMCADGLRLWAAGRA